MDVLRFGAFLHKCRHFELSNQIIRSGTSIGANLAEAIFAASDKDYINIHRISLKEAKELEFWLEICQESKMTPDVPKELIELNQECIKILVAIIKKRKGATAK